jgi:nitrogen fixation NifU-like protein
MPGLEDLYREIILDHYRNPRNRGELSVPPAHRSDGFNPLCGDEITLFFDVKDGVVDDVRIAAQGCSISQSSASMMSVAIKGKPIDEVREIAREFKAMMSIHETTIGGDGSESIDAEGGEPAPVDERKLGDLAALQGVVKFPPRIKCATLAWITLAQGLDELAEESAPS